MRGVLGSAFLTASAFYNSRIAHPSWVTRTSIMDLRRSPDRLWTGVALAVVGLLLLAWAWWDLRKHARDEVTGVRSVWIAVGSWSVPLLVAPPVFSGDGWSYVATGYLTGHGLSPYTVTPSALPAVLRSGVSPLWLHTPTPYGPLALGWGGLASQVTSNPWVLLVAYRIFALLGLALLAWAVPRLARRCGQNPGTASWLVLASPFMIAHGVGGLHNDVVMAGLGTAALALTRRERWVWGAALAGAAAAVKVPGGLIAVGVVLLSLPVGASLVDRLRRTAGVAAIAGVVVVASGWLVGVGTGWIHSLTVATEGTVQQSLTHDLGMRLTNLLGVLGVPHRGPHGITALGLIQGAGMALVFLAAIGLVLFWHHRNDSHVIMAIGGLMFALTVMSPVAHYWYYLWCLPLLACVRLPAGVRQAFVAILVLLSLTPFADPALHRGLLTVISGATFILVPALMLAALLRPRVVARARART